MPCVRSVSLVLATALAALAGLFAHPSTAYACTPPPGGLPTIPVEQRVQQANVVVVGEVQSVTGVEEGGVATIAVREYLKGDGPQTITVSGFGPRSLCLSEVATGDVRVFYGVADGTADFRALYLTQFDAVAPASEALIAQIQTAVPQRAAYPEPPLPTAPLPAGSPTVAPPAGAAPTATVPVIVVQPTIPPAANPQAAAAPPYPIISSAPASQTGVPIPQTSVGLTRNFGLLGLALGALALAGMIALVRRPPKK